MINPPSKEELMKEISMIVDSLAATLEGVHDIATANQSLAGIEKATDQVLALNLQRLPNNYQPEMMEDVKPMVFSLVRILKKLYKLPGFKPSWSLLFHLCLADSRRLRTSRVD